jgi:hypothetical protein|tara:strand:+ start:95 stop:229 length:135 start_codon:yes stop_codon:yes gene_type:complete
LQYTIKNILVYNYPSINVNLTDLRGLEIAELKEEEEEEEDMPMV